MTLQTRTVPPDAPETAADAQLARPARLSRDLVALLAIVALAAVLRFWDLGTRAYHHDESLHAVYSWYLYTGRGYVHDPLMHGPFQFHGTALMYFLFGVSDYTARILPALLGTLTVAVPYFLRDRLGTLGTLAASALLAISPSFLYYHRFLREDTYVALWNLLLVVALWGFTRTSKPGYMILGAAALSLAFATKETTYLTVAIFGSYLVLANLREVLTGLRRGFKFAGLGPQVGFMVMLGTLTLPMGSAGIILIWNAIGFDPAALGANPVAGTLGSLAKAGAPPGDATAAALGGKLLAAVPVVALLLGVAAVLGRWWNWRLWTLAAATFFSVFALLFTTFFTNMGGIGSGLWGALEYWIAQHDVQRGNQPLYYYLLLIPQYEFLSIALALAGVTYYAVRRRFGDPFLRFLVWWLLVGLPLYSYAGEKMPWLSIHISTPLVLMAGMAAGEFVPRVPWRALWRPAAGTLVLTLPLLLLGLRSLLAGAPAQGETVREPLVLLLLWAAVLTVAAAAVWAVRRLGARKSLVSLAGVGLVVAAAFTVRTSVQLSFVHSDTPVEMMIYTQTSPQVPRIARMIDAVAAQTGQGKEMPITVDAAEGFTWPWAWYLRDYTRVGYPDLSRAPGDTNGTVLLLNANSQAQMDPFLGKYGPGQRYPHRWWFPEDYRNLTMAGFFGALLDPKAWLERWDYAYNRTLASPLGSSDALAYFPKDTAGAGGTGQTQPQAPGAQPPPLAAQPLQGAAVLVGRGSGTTDSLLQSPKDLAVDRDGFVFVADTRAQRVFKFDPTGQLVAQVGGAGTGAGQFNEPWGLAVDTGGNVYVADTWNHRVQKFDSQLRFVAQWGSFSNVTGAALTSQAPITFFGPRDMAVDADGNLWVTDTGNKRIQKFTPMGAPLGSFGAPGRGPAQFQEPVGIAIAANGDILVADTWNRRVQRFSKEFRFLSEFPAIGWAGQSVVNKPYLAVDGRGNVVVTDPETHRLIRFDAAGTPKAALGRLGADLSTLNAPAAVAFDGQGRLLVADANNARILRLPAFED